MMSFLLVGVPYSTKSYFVELANGKNDQVDTITILSCSKRERAKRFHSIVNSTKVMRIEQVARRATATCVQQSCRAASC